MAIRVALGDDSLLVREGIVRLLEQVPQVEVVSVCSDFSELLEAIDAHQPDVVLTDIRMPPSHGMEGIELADRLRGTHPETGVVVLSQYADPQYALRLFEFGSARRGYLLKDSIGDRSRLVEAIEEVAAGGSVIDIHVVEALIENRHTDDASPLERLTPREREVLGELASGKSNAAIARSLVISKRAVERHIGSIFAKLDLPEEDDVSRRVQATLVFLGARSG